MKINLTILLLFFASLKAFPQTKNNLSVLYGIGSADVNIHGVVGDFGYQSESAHTFGLSYTRYINKIFSLEADLTLLSNNIKETSIMPGNPPPLYDKIKMVTIPVLGKVTFLKYLYADAGFTFDFQTNYSSASVAPKQSGIGFQGDIGAKYTFGSITIFASPYFQYHSIVRFDKDSEFNLTNTGFKFGAGYNF
ncbi:porin family protein [Mucilaginibacter corticis]|uniref:Porin family protein n=1 Tax=Mucilaginibacter corticis TaxID=2597670 RepID=A0A556MM34_9SPHI|nr:outer membrane beta-barrel protein [Mucilaginibacter corticis]TSJ40902.1 porin family protein [Mucilaginibacter corticis]